MVRCSMLGVTGVLGGLYKDRSHAVGMATESDDVAGEKNRICVTDNVSVVMWPKAESFRGTTKLKMRAG